MKETPNAQPEASFARTVEKAIICREHKNATAKRSHDHQDQTEMGMEVDHHEEGDAHLEEEDKVEDVPRMTIAPRCGTKTRKVTGRS